MDAIHDLKCFWSSLITEKGLIPHIENLMKINDVEERGLALMSRVFFLWCMGLKFEREDLNHKVLQIQAIINRPNERKAHCANCWDIKSLIMKKDGLTGGDQDLKSTEAVDLCDLNTSTSKRKGREHSPYQAKRLRKGNKENVDSSPEQTSSLKIFVPETEYFTQGIIDAKQELVIPETLPLEDSHYGDTDFFQESPKCYFDLSPKSKIEKSPVLGKLNKASVTPVQTKTKSSLRLLQSPERVTLPLSPEHVKKTREKSLLKSPDSLNNSPSLLGFNSIKSLQSPTKRPTFTSPFKEKQNITPSVRRDSVKAKPSSINVIQKMFTSPSSTSNDSFHPKRKLMYKTRSEVGNTISKRCKLSRIKTLAALKDSRPDIEVNLDSPFGKKNYRQMKITQNSFIKNTNVAKLTGGKCAPVQITHQDDDKAIAKAIEESIHTKEIEDLMREKHKLLDQESPGKLKKLTRDQNNKQRSIEKSSTKNSPTKTKKSPIPNFGGPSGLPSQVTVEEVLADLEDESGTRKEEEKQSRLRRTRKKTVVQDSFDMLPEKDDEPAFAYKGNVARKKQEKMRLQGWDCHECRNYYEAKGISTQEKKDLQNKCSRHRSKHKPVTNTPEGFWVLGWSDDEPSSK